MLSVSSDLLMDGPFWPHLAGDAHIGESPCRRAENGGPYVCFAGPAVVIVAPFFVACSSCASAHHHNCKRCSSSSVFASVQSINYVTLLAARPFRCEACGFLMSFVLDPFALRFGAFQESDIDSSAVHLVCAFALVAVAHAFPHWLA